MPDTEQHPPNPSAPPGPPGLPRPERRRRARWLPSLVWLIPIVAAVVGVSLLVRVLYHLYQGPLGALSILVFGIVITVYFVMSNKLWPPVVCHVVADVVPFLL